jgi:hypothetical protein
MKKLALIFILTISTVIGALSAPLIQVFKKGGGANGYYTIYERHDSDGSVLSCSDPGYSSCEFSTPPTVVGASGTPYDGTFLVGLAEEQIALGNTSGTIIHNGGIIITYSGTVEDCIITVDHYIPGP